MAACHELEVALQPHCGVIRPHWGKLHHMGASPLVAAYGDDTIRKFRTLVCQTLHRRCDSSSSAALSFLSLPASMAP